MKKIMTLLVAATVVWGCSDDTFEKEDSDVNYDPAEVITVEPSTTALTRGTMVGAESQMASLGIFASYTGLNDWTVNDTPTKMFNREMNRNISGKWVYNGAPVKWNAADPNDRFTFFSYAPFATGNYDVTNNPTGNGIVVNGNASAAGIPTLTYTVPSNCPNQPDLMVSLIKKNIRQSPSAVSLSMQHALTSVGFRMIGDGQVISKVTVKGVKSVGTLALDGSAIAWTNVSGSSDLDVKVQPGVILGPTGQQINTVDGYMMMIPQTLDANAKIFVTLVDGSTREAKLNNQVWAAGKHVDYIMTVTHDGMITISPSTFYIPSNGGVWSAQAINVVCEYPDQEWTLNVTDPWLQIAANANGTGAGQTISGQGSSVIYLHADAYTGSTDRTTTITLKGNTVVNVIQLKKIVPSTYVSGGILPTGTTSYIGAFWRSDQKGERIIRINVGANAGNLGPWVASVAWMDANWVDGDIVMSTDATLDPNVNFATVVTPGNAESYPVNGLGTVASGTVAANGYIYFRLGLKTTFVPNDNKPARYAVVVLRYGTPAKEQLMYLRQGQDPDYLMRPNETGTPNSSMATRQNAVRFSPYNLTATSMSNGGIQISNHPVLSAQNPAKFTAFPTQTGAFFQWASSLNPLVAYHPGNPVTSLSNWSNVVPSASWTSGFYPFRLIDLQEGCPEDYTLSYGITVDFRRPTNGSTNSTFTSPTNNSSEAMQSLFVSPPTALATNSLQNFMFGYYADGFFDRRKLETVTGGNAQAVNQVVSWGKVDVACSGSLMFNPATNASLFFPASGYRSTANPANGALDGAGLLGSYLTSSSYNPSDAWVVNLGSSQGIGTFTSTAVQARGTKARGVTIRCVRN